MTDESEAGSDEVRKAAKDSSPPPGGGFLAGAWRDFGTGGRPDDLASPLIRRIKFLNYYLFVTVLVCLVFGPLNVVGGRKVPGATELFVGVTELVIGITGVGMLLFIRRTKRIELAQTISLLYAMILMIVLLLTGGIEKTGIFWWYCIPPGAFFLMGRRRGWWWVLGTAGLLAADMALIALGRIESPYTVIQLRQFLVSYLVISFIMFFYEIVRDDYAQLIERKSEEALETNVQLKNEIREKEEAQRALEAAKREADRANAAKSEFLSRMSHELRTPMNSILGFSQLMETDTLEPLTPHQQESVRQILAAGNHLLALINEVLDLSRVEAGRLVMAPEPVALGPLVGEALGVVKPLADPRGIALLDETAAASGLRAVADPNRLKQVLLNLLSNAIKYNRDGGLVVVKAFPSAPGRVQLSVTDTGAGIPPDQQALVFEPFQRLSADQTSIEGTGIGLTIAKKIVEAMGGTIALTSAPGLGSCFAMEFPARDDAAPQGAASAPEAPAPAGGAEAAGGTVLYIEDDPANMTLVKHLLGRRPSVGLLLASSGREGLDQALSKRPGLILLDVHLPDMNGREVFRKLREAPETSRIPVVVVSASAMPQDVERLLAQGVDRYLTKPLDVGLFLDTIDQLLGRTARAGGGET